MTPTTPTDDAGAAVRPFGHALLLALPAIGLMTLILWTFVLMSAMSLALFVDLEIIGVVFFLLVFGVPAGWANWHMVRLAIDAERRTPLTE